jgi:hypothetical protein
MAPYKLVVIAALAAAVGMVHAQQPAARGQQPAARGQAPAGRAQPAGPAAIPLAFEAIHPIAPPAHPLSESGSARVTKFAFIVYGDTRNGTDPNTGLAFDGTTIHPAHRAIMDTMLATIRKRQRSAFPVRFVLQTGDAVLSAAVGRQLNVSYVPVIERLTKGADIPYYLTIGNHDASPTAPGDPIRQLGLHNTLSAIAKLIPPEGSPRRLNGYGTYAFGYGNVFVIAYDSTIAADPLQLAWVTDQLEHLDRRRYPLVFVMAHYPPYSSGPHGGTIVEPQTQAIRTTYMPLFRKHHVRLVLAGHEHFFEHWVERYDDGGRPYRLDMLLTGGGGAPTYTYRAEPDLTAYLASGAAQNVRLEHDVKPGATIRENPNHFVVIEVDGNQVSAEVVAAGNAPFTPFAGQAQASLNDAESGRH